VKPEIKKKWIAALRSGDYEVGYGQLYTAPKAEGEKPCHCALGVLAEVAIKEGLEFTPDPENPSLYRYGRAQGYCYVPEALGKWADIPPEVQAQVVRLNDSSPDDVDVFERVADWLEGADV
jgi:hypothetical protein